MLTLLETFFQQFGYAAVFFVLVICGFGIPIPEDVTLVAGGVISGLGYTNVQILRFRLIAKLMPPKRYAQVQQQFDKHGNRVLFVARFIPGLRSPIFLTAGMSGKVSFWQWLIMDGLAALISVPIWIYLGDFGAENRDWLMHKIHQFQNGFMGLVVILTLWLIWFWWRKRQNLLERKKAILAKRKARQAKKRNRSIPQSH